MGVPPTKLFAALHETIASAPAAAEEEVLASWRAQQTFQAVQQARAQGQPFVFWEGPPTANGKPGIHHVAARTVKDTVCRYQTMRGRRVTRKAGWDTHGLPVELEVEKKLGISGKPQIEQYGVGKFNAQCRESVWTYKKDWEELSERIGYWLDYQNPYVTYSEEYVESVWYLLKRFHEAGLVYHGRRVLPYCGRCGTGLSSHELGQPGVYRDVHGSERHGALPNQSPIDGGARELPRLDHDALDLALELRARRPSRASSTCARGVASKAKDSAVTSRSSGSAKARADAVLPKGFEVLDTRAAAARWSGASTAALRATQSLLIPNSVRRGRPVLTVERTTVYAAEFVTTEDGTGIVHQACYGVDDWEVATRERITTLLGPGAGRSIRRARSIAPRRRGPRSCPCKPGSRTPTAGDRRPEAAPPAVQERAREPQLSALLALRHAALLLPVAGLVHPHDRATSSG